MDSSQGNDLADGRSRARAWRSLDRVNAAEFAPGDRVLFRTGGVWSGQLRVTPHGAPGRPVRFHSRGKGPRPRIETAGAFEDAVVVRNAQHVEVRDFEITNRGQGDQPRRGVNIIADNCGPLTNIVVSDLFIHDVNGTQGKKGNGGIIFRSLGERVPSRYDGLRLERNIIWRVDRSSIAAQSDHAWRTRWFPSTHVIIRDNWVGDVGGDGIVPWATDGCLVAHNVLQDVQAVLLSDWTGWAKDLECRDNLFHAEGVARFGHEVSRTRDGAYRLGANSRLNLAGIGAGGKGTHDLAGVAGENIVALCDIDLIRLDAALKKYPGTRGYRDFRVLFDKETRNIDAVVVSTPDHLHFHPSMMAVQRKKHVYCQKPMTHTVWEARTLATAARKAGVATQMGNQGISAAQLRRDAELLHAGAIGDIREIHCWTDRPGKWWKQGLARPTEFPPVPAHLDWDLFVGPAPYRPYHPAWAQFLWRGWWDFGTGPIGDMGCHLLNLATLALDLHDPVRIQAKSEGKNDDCGPLWAEIIWNFPAHGKQPAFKFFWYDGGHKPEPALAKREQRDEFPDNGVIIIGSKDTFSSEGYNGGGRFLSGAKYEDFKHVPETLPKRKNWDQCHYDEWLDACKGGPKALSNFDVSGPVSEVVLLGQLAVRVGQPLEWNAKKLKVTNVPEANRFVKTKYRKGWSV